MRRLSAWLIAVGAVLANPPGAAAATFTYVPIDVPRAVGTVAYGLNGNGQIVGSIGTFTSPHGFLLSGIGGAFTPLNVPGSTTTDAFGINAGGQIVGGFGANNTVHGYLLTGGPSGTYTQLDVPGSGSTDAFGI